MVDSLIDGTKDGK